MSERYVTGLDETLAVLSQFPAQMERAAVRQGMTAAARVIRDEARLRAPKKTGLMAKAIRSGSPRRMADGTYSVSVRLTGNNHAFLGLFHEYGTSPHFITAGDSDQSARRLTQAARREGSSDVGEQALVINGNFVRGAVMHPGTAPRPFMRPALDIKAEEAVDALGDKIKDYVNSYTGFQSAA